MNFKDKVVLVTGSSRGIGRSTIEEFASLGANVIINYVNNEDMALELKNEVVSKYGVDALVVKCDVSKEEEVKDMVNTIISHFGKIDILVNNAAISMDDVIDNKTSEDFMRVIGVNLLGPFLTSKYIGRIMFNQKSGKIINITSTNGIDTYYKESMDYDASKAGLISLTHNLALEFSPYVNVNAVAAGWVNTDVNKDLEPNFRDEQTSKILLNRFAESKEIAKTVVFLASDNASYINSSIIRVDGGYKG